MIAKRALELARDEYLTKYGGDSSKKLLNVNYHHVIDAFNEVYNSKQSQLLANLRQYEILVVLATYLEMIIGKSEKALLDKV